VTDESAAQRREIYYSGRVQGVGFRYTVRGLAGRFAVTGFVRNLRDGRVHLVAEGEPAEVRALLDAIQAEMGHYIQRSDESSRAATGELSHFEIRF